MMTRSLSNLHIAHARVVEQNGEEEKQFIIRARDNQKRCAGTNRGIMRCPMPVKASAIGNSPSKRQHGAPDIKWRERQSPVSPTATLLKRRSCAGQRLTSKSGHRALPILIDFHGKIPTPLVSQNEVTSAKASTKPQIKSPERIDRYALERCRNLWYQLRK